MSAASIGARCAAAAFVSVALGLPAHGQQAVPAVVRTASAAAPAAASSPFAAIAAEVGAKPPPPQSVPTVPPSLVEADARDLAEYIRWQRQFARESWDWHLSSTKLLMYVVLAIVAFGLFITYLQFTRDDAASRRRRRVAAKVAGDAAADSPAERAADEVASKLKIGLDGVEVSSQIIGLLVLGFSLAFFYLYVKVVYPMQEVDLQAQAHSAAQSAAKSGAGK